MSGSSVDANGKGVFVTKFEKSSVVMVSVVVVEILVSESERLIIGIFTSTREEISGSAAGIVAKIEES